MTTNETLSKKVETLQGIVYLLVGFVLVLVVTAVVGIPQLIDVSNRANDASKVATQAVKDNDRTQQCLINFGSDFVDALNARTSDTATYQEADDARDKVLVKLLTATSITDQRILGEELLSVTRAKQAALQSIKDGRKSDKYPDPPREVCPK